MEHRLFVKLSAFTGMALTLPLASGCRKKPKEMAVAQPLLFSHIVDAKTINEAGLSYRKTQPSEDSEERLSQLLLSRDMRLDPDEIEIKLNEKVVADFKQGNTLILKDWVMVIPEARQSALF